jgi:hypothetical protein
LLFCRRRPLRFNLRRPVNGGDALAGEGVGLEGRGIRNWEHALIGDDVRHHMRPKRLRAAIPIVAVYHRAWRTDDALKCRQVDRNCRCQGRAGALSSASIAPHLRAFTGGCWPRHKAAAALAWSFRYKTYSPLFGIKCKAIQGFLALVGRQNDALGVN